MVLVTLKRRKSLILASVLLILLIRAFVYHNSDPSQSTEKLISLLEQTEDSDNKEETDRLITDLKENKSFGNKNTNDKVLQKLKDVSFGSSKSDDDDYYVDDNNDDDDDDKKKKKSKSNDNTKTTTLNIPEGDSTVADFKKSKSKSKSGKSDSISNKPEDKEEYYKKQRAIIIKSIFSMIASAKPEVEYEKIVKSGENLLDSKLLSEAVLSDYLQFDDSFIEGMQRSHSYIIDQINGLNFPKGMYKGNGIAMVGGDKYSFMCLVSLKMMRQNGGTLPVEIIMPDRDKDDLYFCDTLAPELNAKCIYLSDLLGENYRETISINKYQYKGLALLASSFDNLLLLDSDNIPVGSLTDDLFEQDPFKSYGMVFWPDFWRRTTHPVFYNIANKTVSTNRIRDGEVELPKSQRSKMRKKDAYNIIPFHDREGATPDKSTESGQLLISKSRHTDVLLLSLYYNAYGPHSYYDILSQDVAGEGDKDTFPVAATVLDKKFYQLKAGVQPNGFNYDDGYHGSSMIQFDAVLDYENYLEFIELHKASDEMFLPEELSNYIQAPGRSSVMFLHANFPKLLPVELLHDFVIKQRENKETGEKEKYRIQMYTDDRIRKSFEYELWDFMYDYLCKQKITMAYTTYEEKLNDPKLREAFCEKELKPHINFLKEKANAKKALH